MNRILHIGLGSFHRAHQAVYLNRLLKIGETNWTLSAGNTRPDMAETITALQAQNGAYMLETISPRGEHTFERITAITEVIGFTEDLSALLSRGADADTKIISFTVTEAGYYLNLKNRLESSFADLVSDVVAARAGQPCSTLYGVLTSILRRRMLANAGAVTLLCCDNLRHNGDRSRSGLLQFIELVGDHELLSWVQANTTSPNAMVDRITPRPTQAVRDRVRDATGIDDAAAVMGESFIQWVIEDNFIAGRPALEKVGVEMVSSVAAFEEAKIRILNASHSCIAWAGTLVGHLYIHQGALDAEIRKMAFDYVSDDVIPVLSPSPINLENYRDMVLDRFSNAAVVDTNQRVAMDGFSKIPGFIVPTIRGCLLRDEPILSVAMLPALFLAYLQVWHRGGLPYAYVDQAMDSEAAHAICESQDPIVAFCASSALWGSLVSDERLVSAVRDASKRVAQFVDGARLNLKGNAEE